MIYGMNYFDDLNNMFGGLFNQNVMKADLEESDEAYLLTVELPGFSKDSIEMDFDDSTLNIHAKKDVTEGSDKRVYLKREISQAEDISRSFYLENADENKITAKFENGILQVIVAKKQKEAPKRKLIAIE